MKPLLAINFRALSTSAPTPSIRVRTRGVSRPGLAIVGFGRSRRLTRGAMGFARAIRISFASELGNMEEEIKIVGWLTNAKKSPG